MTMTMLRRRECSSAKKKKDLKVESLFLVDCMLLPPPSKVPHPTSTYRHNLHQPTTVRGSLIDQQPEARRPDTQLAVLEQHHSDALVAAAVQYSDKPPVLVHAVAAAAEQPSPVAL